MITRNQKIYRPTHLTKGVFEEDIFGEVWYIRKIYIKNIYFGI